MTWVRSWSRRTTACRRLWTAVSRPHSCSARSPTRSRRGRRRRDVFRPRPTPEGLSATDLGIVLATEGGADLVVVTGSPASFDEMLDLDREAAAATLAVRLRGGERVVDAPAVLALNHPPVGVWPVVLLLAGGVAALVVSLLAVPGGTEMLHRLRDALPW